MFCNTCISATKGGSATIAKVLSVALCCMHYVCLSHS
jgi:hypothetical protein